MNQYYIATARKKDGHYAEICMRADNESEFLKMLKELNCEVAGKVRAIK